MKAGDLYKEISSILSNITPESNSEARMIISHLQETSSGGISFDAELDLAVYKLALEIINKRVLSCEPLSYILGYSYFYGRKFSLNRSCLIPRFDSEWVVEKLISRCRNVPFDGVIKIADFCSGSGCLGITIVRELQNLKNNIKFELSLFDISEAALDMSKKNADFHEVLDCCKFNNHDLLLEDFVDEKFDIIISNPPYIRSLDIEDLDHQVKDFEPRLALDGGHDGLIFYTKLNDILQRNLTQNGFAAIEFGWDQADDVRLIFQDNFELELIKDLGNRDRGFILKHRRAP